MVRKRRKVGRKKIADEYEIKIKMESEKIIQEQITKAPKEIRDVLAGDGWSQTINQIAQTNTFSDEQKTALENEVLFVLLGMELLSGLQSNIQSSLAITPEIAQSIVQKVKTEILNAIEEFLPKELEDETEDTTVPEEPSLALEIPPEDLPAVISDVVKQPTTNNVQPTTKPALKIPENLPTDSNVPSFGVPTTDNIQPTTEKKELGQLGSETSTISKASVSLHYPQGQDPYREPIE